MHSNLIWKSAEILIFHSFDLRLKYFRITFFFYANVCRTTVLTIITVVVVCDLCNV